MHVSNIHYNPTTKARTLKARCSYILNLPATTPHVVRSLRLFPTQSRSLWWWSRHGNEWSTYLDEHLQTRLQREQKILRYKYSKALRRRALWEREAVHPWWGWRVLSNRLKRRWRDEESMSSSSRPEADVQDPKK